MFPCIIRISVFISSYIATTTIGSYIGFLMYKAAQLFDQYSWLHTYMMCDNSNNIPTYDYL